MVLPDAEDVEAGLIRELDLFDEIAQPLCRSDPWTDVGKGVETKFYRRFLSGQVRRRRTYWISSSA